MAPPAWQSIIDFWFFPADSPQRGQSRKAWFDKDPQFDALIRVRFGEMIGHALAGAYRSWDGEAEGGLARILLLDQFTRNVFRDTPQAFSGDALALAAAQDLADRGGDRTLAGMMRQFAYLPFEHAEDLAAQERSVALFSALAGEDAAFADTLDYARRHREIIARFGRFPHRNRILGRTSTPAEEAFLRLPGSSF